MITDGFDFIAVMFGLCGLLVWVEHIRPSAFFRWFPSIVLVMFGSMTLYTLGAWEMTDDIRAARATVRDNLIPAMLFLMSLKFNLAIIKKLGARLIILCLASTLSIMIGFVVVHEIMSGLLGEETPLTFATMSAGWTGGTQNFVAVKEALSVTDAAMTYTLLMGALCYSVWLVIIIAVKPLKERFNRFLRASDQGLEEVLSKLEGFGGVGTVDMRSLMLMIGLSLVVASVSNHLSIDNDLYLYPSDTQALETLSRYIVRCPVSLQRLHYDKKSNYVLYQPKSKDRKAELLDPLDFLARVLIHIPQPKQHSILYYGHYARRTTKHSRKKRPTADGDNELSASQRSNLR